MKKLFVTLWIAVSLFAPTSMYGETKLVSFSSKKQTEEFDADTIMRLAKSQSLNGVVVVGAFPPLPPRGEDEERIKRIANALAILNQNDVGAAYFVVDLEIFPDIKKKILDAHKQRYTLHQHIPENLARISSMAQIWLGGEPLELLVRTDEHPEGIDADQFGGCLKFMIEAPFSEEKTKHEHKNANISDELQEQIDRRFQVLARASRYLREKAAELKTK